MAKYNPGTYQSEAQGFLDKVKVEVEVSENEIENVTVQHEDTPDVGGQVIDKLAEEVNTTRATDFDSISGATHSSRAFKEALEEALREARGDEDPDPYIPGTFEASADGYKGVITLHVTFSSDRILDIESKGIETEELGGEATDKIVDYVLESQNTEFDYVSGATYTSRAVKEALDNTISQAKDEFVYDELPRRRSGATLDFGTGQVDLQELKLILDNLPVEITFVDKNDRFVYFNKRRHQELAGTPRSRATLGSHVLDCHPPQIRGKVEEIIRKLKAGESRNESMWYTKGTGQKFFLTYVPLFDENEEYVGLLEYVQNGSPFIETAEEKWNRQTHDQYDVNPFVGETQEDVDAWIEDAKEKGIEISRGAEYEEKQSNADATSGPTIQTREEKQKEEETDATSGATSQQ
jgi:hypothetical protein